MASKRVIKTKETKTTPKLTTKTITKTSKPIQDTYLKIKSVVRDEEITRHIIYACSETKSSSHCINTLLGIANAESSMFTRCYKNSCLGLKPGGKLSTYPSVKYCIDHRMERYNKFRYKNTGADYMIHKSKYCVGDCQGENSNRKKAFNKYKNFISY